MKEGEIGIEGRSEKPKERESKCETGRDREIKKQREWEGKKLGGCHGNQDS